MNDNYSHINNTVFYISESIPGPRENSVEYSDIINNYNSQITFSCKCDETCSVGCPCRHLSKDSKTTIKSSTNHVLCNESKLMDLQSTYLLECNDNCTCTEKCTNRVVQKGPIQNLTIKSCTNVDKGYGLYTETFIPKETFICEYAGEIITKNEADKRHCLNSLKQKMNYIFCLNEVVNERNMQTFIDPSVFGNIGRYINHSCDPNSIVIPVRINCPIPKLAIFSHCDIHPGSEITFHYGINNLICQSTENISSRKLCLCQSSQCSGLMPFNTY